MKIIIFTLVISILSSCSNISLLNQNYYSPEFLKKIESIQLIYKDGDKQSALMKLRQLPNESLSSDELAKKYNLLGVMYFSQSDINAATENFQLAKKYVERDKYLSSQISLNLSSSYLKNQKFDLTKSVLGSINPEYFNTREKKKYYKLKFTVANQMNDHRGVVTSLLHLTNDLDTFSKVEYYQYKEVLLDSYKELSPSERVYLIDKFESSNKLVSAYLGRAEVSLRFYSGDKSGAQDVVEWLGGKFDSIPEIRTFIDDFKYRVDNFSKISSSSIGVVVPLSGKFKKYGKQVLKGINTALSLEGDKDQSLKVFVKNNKNNKLLSKTLIQELIFKHNVSVIIGGLFPDLAKEEYLEAKKYGVLFISLSPIYLPREQKDHLLIEVSGSVESQLEKLLTDKNLEKFGKRLAILYPETQKGQSYVNELWRIQATGRINITNLNNYKKGIKQYLAPVKKLLYLNNPRERKEELKIWKEIKSYEKGNMRVINQLPPIVDFDWVFLPAVPGDAVQIISSFSYYDAKKIKFIGGPSWNSRNLIKQRKNLGKMYFVGNDTKAVQFNFSKKFSEHNKGKRPHLVDTLSYEGTLLVLNLLKGQKFQKRIDLEKRILSFKELKGLTSSWINSSGIWIKEMDILEITRRGLKKVNDQI
jgi:hypothetical protein